MAVGSCGDIHALPESCIAHILSFTSPKDACRLSLVASTFCSASRADSVWGRFLPSDYRDILSRAVEGFDSGLDQTQSKKDLYFYLCDHPILIDGGRKSFSLDKSTGKKRYMLAARELYILWGHMPELWQWISCPLSRFSEVAELVDVPWLGMRGCINTDMLSAGIKYAAYFVFSFNSTAYGFENCSAEAFVGITEHKTGNHFICLDPMATGQETDQNAPRNAGFFETWNLILSRTSDDSNENIERPIERDDGWMEVKLGEHFLEGGEDGSLDMILEVVGSQRKSGLIVEGVEIRPTPTL